MVSVNLKIVELQLTINHLHYRDEGVFDGDDLGVFQRAWLLYQPNNQYHPCHLEWLLLRKDHHRDQIVARSAQA